MLYTPLQYNHNVDNRTKHLGKVEDCTHAKFVTFDNSEVHTWESFDDCTHEKLVRFGKFSGAHLEMPIPGAEMKSFKLLDEW